MNSAEASVLAWFTDREPPVGLGEVDTGELMSALVKYWPEWMNRLHKITVRMVKSKYAKINDRSFATLHMNRELMFEDMAYARSLDRIKKDLTSPEIWKSGDVGTRISIIINREKFYNKLRIQALAHRVTTVVEYAKLRSNDPRSDTNGGALWVLDPTKETHTDDCLAMDGKVWSWSVLRFVNPANRHPGCGCHLKPNFDRVPLLVPPSEAMPNWDMGPVSPKSTFGEKYEVPTFDTLHRSQYT